MKSLQKTIKAFSILLTMALVGLGANTVRAEKLDLDFTIHNETGVVIHKLYVSAHSSNDWEEDLLDGKSLKDGEEIDISFSPKEDAEKWDVRVEDADGNSIEWENLKLTEITDLILHYKNGKAWADIKNGDN